MKHAWFSVLLAVVSHACADPCSGVDRSLSAAERDLLAPVIEAHLKAQLDPRVSATVRVDPLDVLDVFRVGSWRVVHVNDHATDDPYLVYSESPSRSARYVTAWAGGARADEGLEINKWVLSNAPGIPSALASCFAWYVTKGLAE